MSKMSAHTSSTMFCRRYPQVTTSASRKVSSRGRPSPLSHGSSSRSATQHSSSPSCSSSSPDIRSYRNGFSVVERCGVETSFLSAGEAVACYPVRRGVRFSICQERTPPIAHAMGFCILHQGRGKRFLDLREPEVRQQKWQQHGLRPTTASNTGHLAGV